MGYKVGIFCFLSALQGTYTYATPQHINTRSCTIQHGRVTTATTSQTPRAPQAVARACTYTLGTARVNFTFSQANTQK